MDKSLVRQKMLLQKEIQSEQPTFEVKLYQAYVIECPCDLLHSHAEKQVFYDKDHMNEWIKEHIKEIQMNKEKGA